MITIRMGVWFKKIGKRNKEFSIGLSIRTSYQEKLKKEKDDN